MELDDELTNEDRTHKGCALAFVRLWRFLLVQLDA